MVGLAVDVGREQVERFGVGLGGEVLEGLAADGGFGGVELVLGLGEGAVEAVGAAADLAGGVEQEQAERIVACAGDREVGAFVGVDDGEIDHGPDAFVGGGGLGLAGAGPGLAGLVAAAGDQAFGVGRDDHGGDEVGVAVAAAAVLGFEGAAGVGEEELVVGAGGEEAQFLGFEAEGGDGAFVELGGVGGFVGVLVLAFEDGDGSVLGADRDPAAGRVGGDGGAGGGEREGLEQLVGFAVENAEDLVREQAEAVVGEEDEFGDDGFEAGFDWLAVPEEAAVAVRDPGRVGIGFKDEGGGAAGEGEFGEFLLFGVEAVEGGRLALGVFGDERQVRAGGGEGADASAEVEEHVVHGVALTEPNPP